MTRGEFSDMLKIYKEKGIYILENIFEIEGVGNKDSNEKLIRLRSSRLLIIKEISEDIVAKSLGSKGVSKFMPF